jgi:Uri superfamily endonuclease
VAHPLQRSLQLAFPAQLPPAQKRLRWHVDYLLEEPDVRLTGALLLQTERSLETPLAAWLQRHPLTAIPVPGAGAADAPGQTHLFSVSRYPGWWGQICRGITYRFAEEL